MNKKYAALAMGLVLSASLFAGCASGTATGPASEQASTETVSQTSGKSSVENTDKNISDDKIYGQIKSISDDGKITIETGTLKERPDPPSQSSDTSSEEQKKDSSEDKKSTDTEKSDDNQAPSAPAAAGDKSMSILDLTGETMELKVTSDTSITRQSMGGPGGQAPDGQAPNGQAPNGQAPSGQVPSDQAANGDQGDQASNENQDGQAPNGQAPDGQAPDGQAPNGQAPNGQPPAAPSQSNSSNTAQAETLTIEDLSEGDNICVTVDAEGNATEISLLDGFGQGGPGGPGGNGGSGNGAPGSGAQGGGQSQGVDSYTAVTNYTKDTETNGESVESTGTDENAILVSEGAAATINKATVSRKSSDSTGGDQASFYGVGAAVLATEGTANINDSTITTDAKGGAGVFAYGDGTVNVKNTTIKTSQDTSGGIHVAGGGTLKASNLTVETKGGSSAAIRSDRGGGTMTVNGGSYTSKGTGSPAVYSTADITVKNAQLTATNSEAVCIEGKNSLTLTDVDLTGNMPDDQQNDCTWNVILYQSMSGDSEEGNATFSMTGGSLTAKNGGMFYTTNTESTFNLNNVAITYADENDFFLKATGNSNARGWGQTGSNGAKCTFTATDQTMEGDVIWDSISSLDMTMKGASTLKGAIVKDESNAGDGGDGSCNLTISKGSTWTVTGDSSLTKLSNQGSIVDQDGKTVTIKGTDGTTYVKGSSSYVITVSSYAD